MFGTTGMTYFSFSDILGDHQIAFGTEMVLTLENSDYFLQYAYLKNRRDYYFTAFQNADFFNIGYDYYTGLYTTARLRHYGIQFLVSNPFNRYNRIDLGFSWHNISYSILRPMLTGYNYTEVRYEEIESEIFSTILPTISWVYDNSVFGFTGPIDGFRKNTSLTFSPGYGTDSLDFQTMKFLLELDGNYGDKIGEVLEGIACTFDNEFDYRLEAENMRKCRNNCFTKKFLNVWKCFA